MRALLIQQLPINLSDEQMAFHLLDHLISQHFVGLRHASPIPDRCRRNRVRCGQPPATPKENKARRSG